MDVPRNFVLDRVSDSGAVRLVYFLSCPWCLGAWISLALYVGWVAIGSGVWDASELLMAAVSVLALSATVGFLGTALDRMIGR